MPVADVVGREREPSPIGLRHVRWYLVVHLLEEAGSAENALARIGGVADLGCAQGDTGELHQTPCACGGRGARVPLRFLVADGGEQPPILTALESRLLEPLAV